MTDVDKLAALLDEHEKPYVEQLSKIGESIGYGRAQQILGQLWDKRHDCAPRGSMGVTVKDKKS